MLSSYEEIAMILLDRTAMIKTPEFKPRHKVSNRSGRYEIRMNGREAAVHFLP